MRAPLPVTLGIAAISLAGASPSGAAPPDDPAPVATASVELTYVPEEQRPTPVIADELAPSTVLSIRARNFAPDTTGTVKQCVDGPSPRCGNPLAVRFDSSGGAAFQYLVTADAVADGDDACRLAGPRCTIDITVGETSSVVDTVFIDTAPPPGRLEVSPHRELRVGDTVTVTAAGFPPGVDLDVTICAAPSTSGSRCGSPAPVVPLPIAPDGTGTARMDMDTAVVGTDEVACGRQTTCRVVVSSEQAVARAQPVALTFRDTPGARYSTGRLMIGITLAAALLLSAGLLIRFAEWDAPTEADATAIDEADFADLDAEVQAFVDTEPTPSETRGP